MAVIGGVATVVAALIAAIAVLASSGGGKGTDNSYKSGEFCDHGSTCSQGDAQPSALTPITLAATTTASDGAAPTPEARVDADPHNDPPAGLHDDSCFNNTPGPIKPQRLRESPVYAPVHGKSVQVGTFAVFKNLAKGCGMVWAEFWTGNSGEPFRASLRKVQLSIDCDHDGTPHSAEWDPGIDGSKPQSDAWTPSFQYQVGNYYEAVLTVSV